MCVNCFDIQVDTLNKKLVAKNTHDETAKLVVSTVIRSIIEKAGGRKKTYHALQCIEQLCHQVT